MRRSSLAIIIVLFLLLPSVGAAQARGTHIRGFAISTSKPVPGLTGNCTCDTKWFTIGVNRGPVTITGVLKSFGLKILPSYSLWMSVYDRSHFVQLAQVSCRTSSRTCNRSVRVHYRARTRTVMYVSVHAPGAEDVTFTLAVHGKMYRLR